MAFPTTGHIPGDILLASEVNGLYYRTVWDYLPLGGTGSDGALSISSGTTNISGVKQ